MNPITGATLDGKYIEDECKTFKMGHVRQLLNSVSTRTQHILSKLSSGSESENQGDIVVFNEDDKKKVNFYVPRCKSSIKLLLTFDFC